MENIKKKKEQMDKYFKRAQYLPLIPTVPFFFNFKSRIARTKYSYSKPTRRQLNLLPKACTEWLAASPNTQYDFKLFIILLLSKIMEQFFQVYKLKLCLSMLRPHPPTIDLFQLRLLIIFPYMLYIGNHYSKLVSTEWLTI